MKKYSLLLSILVTVLLVACNKDPEQTTAQEMRLRDIVENNLPAPHYHFEYDAAGKPVKLHFSSGRRMYDLAYASGRLSEMKNNTAINHDRLVYQYESGRVSMVKYLNEAGVMFKYCFLDYNVAGQLTEMEWSLKMDAGGFAIQRTLTFSYYADGNLKEKRDQRYLLGGQPESLFIDTFENYDAGKNVSAFSLVHQEDDHLLYVPWIILQKNNPAVFKRSGSGLNYNINFVYSYNQQRYPLQHTGDAVFTNGPNAGEHFPVRFTFTYY